MNSKDQHCITRSMDQMVTRSKMMDRTKGHGETQAIEDDQKQPAKTLVTKKKRKVRLTRKQRCIKEIRKKMKWQKRLVSSIVL